MICLFNISFNYIFKRFSFIEESYFFNKNESIITDLINQLCKSIILMKKCNMSLELSIAMSSWNAKIK